MKGTPSESSHDRGSLLHDWCSTDEDSGQPKNVGTFARGSFHFVDKPSNVCVRNQGAWSAHDLACWQ